MALGTTVLYRGPLSSCNYDCGYCPLEKRAESADRQDRDRRNIERFVDWAARSGPRVLSVFFTPWGECLIRPWYRDAVVALSRLPNVCKVAVQTNLSTTLDWLDQADPEKVALWCTYHPGSVSIEVFLEQCRRLEEQSVSHSVGCVGLKEHLADIQALRAALPPKRYLWINAYKDVESYYDEPTLAAFSKIDPLFPLNNVRHPSLGRTCRCGGTVFAVDGVGDVRRCHFVKEVVGNIYDGEFGEKDPSPCPNETCGCHIGYVHLEHLRLDAIFGDGILERVPSVGTDEMPAVVTRIFHSRT